MEDTMLELVKLCQEKEFLCIQDDINDLIESALNSKLLSINSNYQHINKKEQEVKNVVEQPAERENHNIQSLKNFRVVHKKEEVDFKDISQIQDIVLREKLLSITRLIYNNESLNDNPTPDRVLNYFAFDNSLLDNFRPNSKLFAIIRKRREVERLINLVENDILDDSTNDPLLEEADLFLAANHSIPP
nr:hypothetical protein [Tanacetum cinerariifolium]